MESLLQWGLHLPLLGEAEYMFLHVTNEDNWRLETDRVMSCWVSV